MTAPTVVLRDVEHRYGEHIALHVDDLTVGAGITVVVGRNGCGKTTLLRHVATVLRPTAGSVSIGGRRTDDHDGLATIRGRLGYAPQDDSVPRRQRVFDVVDVIAAMRGIGTTANDRAGAVYAVLRGLDLLPFARQRCGELSGGTHRRVALAAALVGDPSLIVLDEPTTFLDADQRRRLIALLAERAQRATIVIASHDEDFVAAIGGRHVHLVDGRPATN